MQNTASARIRIVIDRREHFTAYHVCRAETACRMIDRATQLPGAAELTRDFFLAEACDYARQIRLAGGPVQVHMMAIGKQLVRRNASREQ